MKNKNIKILVILSFIVIFLTDLYSLSDLIKKYYDEAQSFYLLKDYPKAYARIKFVMKSFPDYEEIPVDISLQSEKIYYDYLSLLFVKNDYAGVNDIIYNDPGYSRLAKDSKRLTELKEKYEIQKQLEEKKAQEERFKAELESMRKEQRNQMEKQTEIERERMEKDLQVKQLEYEKFLKVQEQLQRDKIELEAKTKDQFNKILETTLLAKEKDAKSSTQNIIVVVVFITVVFVILFLLFFLIIFVFMKNSQKQQERMFQFQMQNLPVPTTNILAIPMMPTTINDASQLLADNRSVKGLPSANENAEKIKRLLENCTSYISEIDERTQRKNNAKNVAELVYKISKYIGFDETICMIHYCSTLVHDIGFLDIEKDIFKSENLTEDQYELMISHTTLGLGLMDFVDDEFKPIFKDAISKHHEDLDGTGYPRGLFSDQIPYIARAIRVVESFNAMITYRIYHDVKDTMAAINELKERTDKYDIKIVEALENVI